jgi:hypothetical protein
MKNQRYFEARMWRLKVLLHAKAEVKPNLVHSIVVEEIEHKVDQNGGTSDQGQGALEFVELAELAELVEFELAGQVELVG